MGIDTSKILLNGLLDYSGVKIGQGRVLLDSDFNELNDVLDRRLRAVASDVLGRATVSATTPDAFEIEAAAGGLTIGVGRLYVDGLCAECHGAPSAAAADRVLDPVLDEARFAQPVPYAAQPYYPQPDPLPTTGMHLVYLDVWKRPVTHLEEPDLVETAIGVDSGARDQVAWQVRILPADAGSDATCATPDADLPGWADLIAPSTGVLTTGTYNVPPSEDPCELPPTGGYRGEANQTYRVEIHDPGLPGAGATFKWSRENKSVGSRVASLVNGGEVEVESLGRDDILSFKTGDWVEFMNDYREFALKQGGEMRKIVVDSATRRLTFAPPLPADMAPGPFPDSVSPAARNLRVRRWDHKGKVFRTGAGSPVQIQDLNSGTSGVIAIPAAATTFILENGVTVQFDSTGAKGFRIGDAWVFAARTTDASVELLDRARPREIWHNYARLAMWDAAKGTLTDCRNKWPPAGGDDCSCTACVTADSHNKGIFTIQAAVDKVKPTGGSVCLGPGQYVLTEPVRIDGAAALTIRGQGLASLIVAADGAFEIVNSFLVGIENLGIFARGDRPAIGVDSAIGLSLNRLVMAVLGDDQGVAIGLSGAVAAASIEDNVIFASNGIVALTAGELVPGSTAPIGDFKVLFTAALKIDDNIFLCDTRAISLDGNTAFFLGTRITGNSILGARQTAVSTLGYGLPNSSITISRNDLVSVGSGIRCSGDGIWIEGNKLDSRAGSRQGRTIGIALAQGLDPDGSGECNLLSNQIAGFDDGIVFAAPVRCAIVKMNIVANCAGGIVSTDDSNARMLSIENNQLRDIEAIEGMPTASLVGIGVLRATSATIAGNTIRSLGLRSPGATLRVAIQTAGGERARIIGNEAIEIGPAGTFSGQAIGILLTAPLTDFEIVNNRIERELVTADGPGGDWRAVFVGSAKPPPFSAPGTATGTGTATTTTTAAAAAATAAARNAAAPVSDAPLGALAAINFGVLNVTLGTFFDVSFTSRFGPSGSILGNVLKARGLPPAVEVSAHYCLFNDNRVGATGAIGAGVALNSVVAVVNANRVVMGRPSINIAASPAGSTVLGNVTTGGIILGGSSLTTPWAALNMTA
jgi:hypothetical protein